MLPTRNDRTVGTLLYWVRGRSRGGVGKVRQSSGGALEVSMLFNVYLFIELLGKAKAEEVIGALGKLQMRSSRFSSVVKLNEQKIVAQLDCESMEAAQEAVMTKIAGVDGIVQTNIISVVRPTK
jgi:hypothetical protein